MNKVKRKKLIQFKKKSALDVIATLFFVFAFILFASGIFFIIAGISMLNSQVGKDFLSFFGLLAVAVGIVSIPMSVFYFFVGVGLRKKREWARIAAIVLCLLVVANTIVPIAQEILGLVIGGIVNWSIFFLSIIVLVLNLLIALYLMRNEEARKRKSGL